MASDLFRISKMKKKETRTATITLLEPGIVKVKFKPEIKLEKEDILANIKASVDLTGGKHCALLEIRNNAGISDDALLFAGSRENAEYRIANAIVFKATSVKLLWNFFNMFFKPTVNNKVFRNDAEALKWLRGFRYDT